jgi:ribonucleoside-diphosphate reductase subunit M1
MDFIDPVAITLKVISGIYSGVTTVELDNLAGNYKLTFSNAG